MRYVEVTARVPAETVDAACDAMRAATGGGVSIERLFIQADLESDATIDAGAAALVRAYVAEANAPAAIDAVRRALARASVLVELTQRDVDEEDWAESWKAHFHPERFGERLVVVPTWRHFDASPDDVVIMLDPGMAFGTGQHETTRMCLEAIECAVWPSARVLDVGCGSGILAIAAAKLGARDVLAIDIDDNCVRITEDNARINRVSIIVHTRAGSLGGGWPFEQPPRMFDVVVANITARVIVELAQPLVDAVASGAHLIVSGIIAEREPETIAALEAAGARVEQVRALGDWRCIEATRR